ncbi:Rhodanese-related sulfurtransferase [Desulfitobacterium dichloroeliminans LMG P-21439]|uniref:Rhodanese-related sulfurtransferase n=1 Tax=Desulfitobacterium dichloroeliminans (strain LMG P-21439 / DCA1) TaxID=871963 RepID=L0F7Y3_DESDL|nr:rhodanese-like domain-containing protein [Desulfitobacterium dichloroeliminans]AGA69135.1 Rhodanese-related sulfurtransferase [Desulfitobacterium dichloroeliminans LMG P-21439]
MDLFSNNLFSYVLIFIPAVFVGYLFNTYYCLFNKKVKNIGADEAYELIKNNRDSVVIDVRYKEEYLNGHIGKAKNIPLDALEFRISELGKYKERPLIVYCATGARSVRAVKILLKRNFTQIYHLRRGLRGWNYPLR